jgi:3-oxoacyl-[acyl-carrier-protein] synthase III
MRIDAVTVAFPSRTVENAEILDNIREHSQEPLGADVDRAVALTERWLKLSGAQRRRYLADDETPIALIENAITKALDEGGVRPQDVELLIYVGIGKGFLEPGQSYAVAQAVGLPHVECFDILDACMSWTRAMRIAESFLLTGRYQRILIVNGEVNTYHGGPLFPNAYRLQSVDQLTHTFASYTIGSAATATLVSADQDNPWCWRSRSVPDLADLCTIPSYRAGLFSKPSEKIGRNGTYQFTSYGGELHEHASLYLVDLMRDLLAEVGDVRRVFVHTSSFREWDKYARALSIQDKIHHLYPEYGNLVSASVPAGLATALADGSLTRGDRIAGWVGSAGMSFCAYSFVY